MQHQRSNPVTRMIRPACVMGLAALLSGCFGIGEWGDGKQTTIRPETDSAQVVHDVYALVTWIDLGIFVVVAGLLIFAVVRYRQRPGQEDTLPRQVHGNAAMEMVWTIIPAVILIFIAVPTWSGIFRAAKPPAEGAFAVEAVGHQWWWEFNYPEHGVVTANELYLPAGQPVVVRTYSEDVIHSFWAPKLAGKIDTLPGRTNTVWFTPEETGSYFGQCAEFCGTSHANMRFRVHVVSPEAFQAWLAGQQQPPAPETEAAEEGRQLFVSKGCVACHTITGVPAAVGVLGPDLTNLPARETIASGIIGNTRENLVRWMRHTQAVKPGAKMGIQQPDGSYQPIEMSQEEATRIAAFLRSEPGASAAGAGQAAAMGAPRAAAETGKSAEQLFAEKGCVGCHVIPGVQGAVGTIGPSLAGLMSRETIAAGRLETSEENLRKWIGDPKAVKPDTQMVTPPISEEELDTIVDFLTRLQ